MAQIHIAALKRNPDNPRTLTEESRARLTFSLLAFPEMLAARPITHSEHILGGNQRHTCIEDIAGLSDGAFDQVFREAIKKHSKQLKTSPKGRAEYKALVEGKRKVWEQVRLSGQIPMEWTKDVSHWSEEDKRRFVIQDNLDNGEWDWDVLRRDWQVPEIEEWGLVAPVFEVAQDFSDKNKEVEFAAEDNKMKIVLEYTFDDFQAVRDALARIAHTPEDAVWKLLDL